LSPLPANFDIKKATKEELKTYLARKVLNYQKPVEAQDTSVLLKNQGKLLKKKKRNQLLGKVIRVIKRQRNLWGQTKKSLNKFKRRHRRFKFQKRYKINSKMKFMRYHYFHNYEKLFINMMWIKKGFRKMYGNMTKHNSVLLYQRIDSSLQRKNNLFEKFLGEVECLLPVALYRLRLVPGIRTAKEYIRHGQIMVNGKLITFVNYRLQPNDVITLSHKLKHCYRKRFVKKLTNRQRKQRRFLRIKND
jgi:ribosomal protein S4